MMRISETVKHLIIINVIMFVGHYLLGMVVFYDWFAMHFPKNDAFQPWQIITHMFMHGGFSILYLICLCYMFFGMFGIACRADLGSKRFCLYIYQQV